MTSRANGWRSMVTAAMAGCFLAAWGGCAAEGGEGEACKCDNCMILSGTFSCNPGLICNTGNAGGRYICQRPQSVPQGGGCVGFSSNLCVSGLVCTYTLGAGAPWTCEPGHSPLQLGEPCPSGVGCAPDLACIKRAGGPVCSAPDSGGDAATGDGGETG